MRPLTVPHHAALAGARRAGLSSAQIAAEVREALAQGRHSPERPAWLQPGSDAEPGCCYCWPEHEGHAFIVSLAAEPAVVVRTVVTPSLQRRDFRRCQGQPALARAFERAALP